MRQKSNGLKAGAELTVRDIRVERAIDLDSEGQLVASVLSKKIAAGSSHLVLDLPVGATTKIGSDEAAMALSGTLTTVARSFGIEARTVLTDGTQPVARGIGPALEARDVLSVIQRSPGAPDEKAAGIDLHVRLGSVVDEGQPLYTIHAGSSGELAYASDYALAGSDAIEVAEA